MVSITGLSLRAANTAAGMFTSTLMAPRKRAYQHTKRGYKKEREDDARNNKASEPVSVHERKQLRSTSVHTKDLTCTKHHDDEIQNDRIAEWDRKIDWMKMRRHASYPGDPCRREWYTYMGSLRWEETTRQERRGICESPCKRTAQWPAIRSERGITQYFDIEHMTILRRQKFGVEA